MEIYSHALMHVDSLHKYRFTFTLTPVRSVLNFPVVNLLYTENSFEHLWFLLAKARGGISKSYGNQRSLIFTKLNSVLESRK